MTQQINPYDANSENKSILIIEDSDVDFMAICRALRRAGCMFPVLRCHNGDEAIEALGLNQTPVQYRYNHKPALIMLDLNMPGLNGIDVLKRIKNTDYRSIPVVVLTSSADPTDIDSCYAAGANSYIQKPIAFNDLYQVIYSLKDYWFQTTLLSVTP